jgi:hypothetical protein
MWNAYPKVILFNAFWIQFSCRQINLFSVWTCLDMSGHAWTFRDMSGHFGTLWQIHCIPEWIHILILLSLKYLFTVEYTYVNSSSHVRSEIGDNGNKKQMHFKLISKSRHKLFSERATLELRKSYVRATLSRIKKPCQTLFKKSYLLYVY